LDLLRRSGFVAEVCERWVPGAGVRRDLFYVGDIFAVSETRKEVWLVQACTLTNLAARRKKALQQPELKAFLLAGGRFQIIAWFRSGSGPSAKWDCKRLEITAAEMDGTTVKPIRLQRGRRPKQRHLFEETDA
jgi:hypothetical protein